MIILPNPVPTPAADLDRTWRSISGRTRAAVAIVAMIPPLVAAIGLFAGPSSLAVVGFALTFVLWGGIASFMALQSDRLRERRRSERRPRPILEGSDLSLDERRAAIREAWLKRGQD